ncbi:MAG: hypothetical protein QM762_03475 [Chryseolinea sp.]
MINPLFSGLLAASIVAQAATSDVLMPVKEQISVSYVVSATGSLSTNPGRVKPGKSKKYKKKMSKQMKKRKRH